MSPTNRLEWFLLLMAMMALSFLLRGCAAPQHKVICNMKSIDCECNCETVIDDSNVPFVTKEIQ